MAIETIKDALDGLLKEIKVRSDSVARFDPEAMVKQVFSRKEAQHIQPGNLKNGVLYIKTDSSTWLYYFNLHKKELLEKFSGAGSPVKDLKFNLGVVVGKSRAGERKNLARKKISGKINSSLKEPDEK